MRLVNWRTLIAGAASIALAACGDDVTVVQPTPTLTLNPASVTCVQGTTTAVGVTVSGATGTPAVTFTSSGAAVTVAGSGSGATVNCAQVGSAIITVSVTANNQTVTGAIPVTVTAAPSPITSVTVSPNTATIAIGGTITLTPSAATTSASVTPAFTFTSVQPTIATVDNNGVVKGVAAGVATIRVSTTQAPNIVATATITVANNAQFIQSLSVQPSAVTLQTGSTQSLASTVSLAPGAPAGTSTAVTYTSSDTSVATVSSTGVVTARRNGTAVITVASVAAPTITQAVSITVRDPQPVRLTIQSLRQVNAAGNLVPIDPALPTAGTITATLNLDPGDFRPDSVRLRIGNAIVNCQRFSAELAAAYKAALTTGASDVQAIDCPVNTASFNATSGVANVLNGPQVPLTAEVFFRPQGAASGSQSQTATIQQNLNIQNQSGFFVNVTNTPSAAQATVNPQGQATGPQGVLWRAGAINVTVLPVNFVDVVNPGTQTFTISLQDATGVIAQRTASQTAGASTFTATFPGASANAFNNTGDPTQNSLNGYTSPNAGVAPAFNPQGGYTGGGTLVVVGTAAGTANTVILNSAGQPAGIGSIVGNVGFNNAVATPIFIDNQNPEARAQFVAPSFVLGGGGTAGFINGTFVFSDSIQQSAAASALADFNGVDRVTREFFFASNPAGGPIPAAADIVSGGTLVANGGQIPQNTSQTAFVAAARLRDALGNSTNVSVGSTNAVGGPTFTFGVITVAPTITDVVAAPGTAVIGSNARLGAGTAGTARGISFVATTTSGTAFPANLVVGTVQVVTPQGTFCATQADLVNAGLPSGGVTVNGVSTTTTPPCPQLSFADVRVAPGAANVPNGVYTVSVRARDVAGNVSDVTTRTFVVDVVPPSAIDNPLVATGALTGGQSETFTGTAHDNLSIVDQLGLVAYGAGNLLLRYNGTQVVSATSTSFVPNAALSVNIPFFIRAIALQPTSAPNTFTNVANNAVDNAFGAALGASDPGANWLYAPVGGFALDNTQPSPGNFFGTGATNQPVNASITYQASNVTSASPTFTAGTGCTAGGGNAAFTLNSASTGCATAVTINLVQNGAANVPFQTVFTNVQLFVRGTVPGTSPFGSTTAYTLAGSFGGASTSTSSATGVQTTTNSFTFTPGSNGIRGFPTSAGTATVDALVVASTASGYAIAFQLPTITLANP